MLKWLFFDLGSTLLDETDRVNERIREMAKQLNMNEAAFNEQLEATAKTHPYAIMTELPNGAQWSPWPKRLDPLYPTAVNVLCELHKKYKLGVIANHGKDTAQLLGIGVFFSAYIASEAVGFKKPDLRMFEIALAQSNCRPEEAVMIGDRLDNDIYPAKKLDMKTVWVRQGWGGLATPASEEYMPDMAIDSITELAGAIAALDERGCL